MEKIIIEGRTYANWVWDMIRYLDEDALDKFGPYGKTDLMGGYVDPKVKAFMFLDTMLNTPDDREAFMRTSSEIVIEHLEHYVAKWASTDGEFTDEVFEEMLYHLSEYMEGC
jgi:hypothetical protein